MNQYFQQMDEAYIEKYYPARSLFAAMGKRNKKGSIFVYIFFGGFVTISFALIAFIVKKLFERPDDANIAVVMIIILLGFALLCLIPIILTYKRCHRSPHDHMKISAKESKLSLDELQEFERQAMQSDSYILKMVKGIRAVMSTNSDGVLTRDYICLDNSRMIVMRCDNLLSICLATSSYYANNKKISYLTVNLVTKNGVVTSAETSEHAGKELQQILLERYPSIDVMNGRILGEQEYGKYLDKIRTTG